MGVCLLIFGTIFALLAYYVFEYTNFGMPPPSVFVDNITKKKTNGSNAFLEDSNSQEKMQTIIPTKEKNIHNRGRKFITRL